MKYFIFPMIIYIILLIKSKQFQNNEKKLNSNIRQLSEINLEKVRNDILENHNYHRKRHQVGNLKRNSEIEKIAQEYSEKMASKNSMVPSGNIYNNTSLGENLYYARASLDEIVNGTNVSESWYKEVIYYDFSHSGNKELSRNFTQLVWKGTEQIGCGAACSKSNDCYVACNYYPKGNYLSEFGSNVFRFIDVSDDDDSGDSHSSDGSQSSDVPHSSDVPKSSDGPQSSDGSKNLEIDNDSGGMSTVGKVFLIIFIILLTTFITFLILHYLFKKRAENREIPENFPLIQR